MAHFYGSVIGNRQAVSCCGTKRSGFFAKANGWNIGGEITLTHNTTTDQDVVSFTLTTGTNGRTTNKQLPAVYLDQDGKWTSDNEIMRALLNE